MADDFGFKPLESKLESSNDDFGFKPINVPRETKPQRVLPEAKQEFSNVGKNIGSFAKGAGQGVLNSAINASNFLNRKDTKGFDFAPHDTYGKAGEIGGDVASFALPYSGITKGVSAATSYMPKIANAFNQMKSMLPGAIQKTLPTVGRAAASGASGGLISPEGKRVENALLTAGLGAGGEAVVGGYRLGQGIGNRLFKGNRSPEEAKAIAEQVGDLPVPYGDIVESPGLQALGRELEKVPFSGVGTAREKVANAADKQSEKLLSNMRGNQEEDTISRNIAEKIKENRSAHKSQSSKLYNEVGDIAKENNINLKELDNLKKSGSDYIKEFEKEGSPLSEKAVKHVKELIEDKIESNIITGSKIAGMSFNDAHKLKKSLGKLSRSYEKTDPFTAGVYRDLSHAVKSDMVKSAEKSGNKALGAKLSEADKHYMENVLPYQSRDVFNITKNKKNLENLPNTLLQDTDYAKKILSDLPMDVKKSVAYKKFKSAIKENAEGVYESQPQKLFNVFNNLSPIQKDNLFTKAEQDEFKKLGTLSKLSKGKNSSHSVGLGAGAVGLDVLVALAHSPKAAAALLGLQIGAAGGARVINKLLTNPRIRNSLLQRRAEPTSLNPKSRNSLLLPATGVATNNSLNKP